MEKKHLYGLVGRNISYSFSKGYFTRRFIKNDMPDYEYKNFDIPDISSFVSLIENNPGLRGLNVTIPYKQTVIPYLDQISPKAKAIGAVNTIKFTNKGTIKGYNTDYYGFKKSLKPMLEPHHKKALILGTGGASKAVAYGLEQLDISYSFVSRQPDDNTIDYNSINEVLFQNCQIIINCTPIGTSPETLICPDLPYDLFTEKHIAFDLIYNPAETLFLQKAGERGAKTKNGYDMLVFQAKKAWKIWNK